MNAIRHARQTLGITQNALAEKLGLHQSTISRFENGSLPLDERTRLAIEALLARTIHVVPSGEAHAPADTAPQHEPSPGKNGDLAAPESEAA